MKINIIGVAIYLLFIISVIFQWFFQPFTPFIHNLISLLIGSLGFPFCLLFGKKIPPRLYGLLIIMMLGALMNIFFVGSSDWGNFLWPIGFIGFSILFYNVRLRNDFTLLPLLFVCLYFSIGFVFRIEPARLMKNGSQNSMSTIYLFFIFLHIINLYKNKQKISFILLVFLGFFYLFLGIWTASRASLLCAIVFILFVFLDRFIKVQKKILFLSVTFVLFFLGFCLIWIIIPDVFINLIDRLKYYGLSSARTDIWMEYFELIIHNPLYFIFGGNIHLVLSASMYGANLHNSFLILHAHYGIIPLLVILTYFTIIFIKLARKRNIILLNIFVVYLVRMLFDWVSFAGLLDVIAYLLIIVIPSRKVLYYQKESSKNMKLGVEKNEII